MHTPSNRDQMISGIIPPSAEYASALAETPIFIQHGYTTADAVIALFRENRWQFQELSWCKFHGLADDKIDGIYRSLGTTLEDERRRCAKAAKWLANQPGWKDFGQFVADATVVT